ncbi:hypothetical protein J4438_03955 [Candidatus Woesearchaeota archaeon]|nr:hypothetical protein [Candidatus Woesearchaeota archaeon]
MGDIDSFLSELNKKYISSTKKSKDKLNRKLRISELRKRIRETESPEDKRTLRKVLVEEIKSKGISKLKTTSNDPVEYHITYDTFGQTLEPVYFWVLDFMRGQYGLKLDVNKTEEGFEASVGGGFFGELGTRAAVMQDRAMKILEVVNNILRTIINLIYDLKEFEQRLKLYEDIDPKKQHNLSTRQGAEYGLKSVWMDQVDIKAGLGSINQLTRGDLQFITLRDAFFQIRNIKEVDKFDLNDRVKVILKKKFHEYETWRRLSEVELRKRYDLEKHYLRAQVDSLRLYTKWAKPYLRAAQKLGMKEFKTKTGLPSPDVISTFNNMQMELKLFGKKEVKIEDVEEIKSLAKKLKTKEKYYACLESEFRFRTAPQIARSGQSTHYAHLGVIDIFFRAYVLTDEDIKDIESYEVYEDMSLIEELTDNSLASLQLDLDTYIDEKKETKKEEKSKSKGFDLPNPFAGLKELFSPLGTLFGTSQKEATPYHLKLLESKVNTKAIDTCNTMYSVFKKAHRMIAW